MVPRPKTHAFRLFFVAKWSSRLVVSCAGLALFGAAPAVRGQEPPTATYRNPVIAGDFADPSVILVGDTYYASGTSSEWAPHYPIYTSKDLVNWEHIGHVFEKMPEWTSGSFWAPELFHHKGTFYCYYTARRKSDGVSVIAVATSKDPRKGFTDRGIICEWGSEAIDGFVFQDNDGKFYFSWKAYGLEKDRPVAFVTSEMTDDLLKLKGETFELLQEGGKPISAEGQVMMRRGDWYYLFYSPKGCCGRGCDYELAVARAKNLKGPWELSPVNPILAGGDEWKCPGHGTLVTLPDKRDYFLYHAYNAKENVYTGRQGMLGEISWQDNGWPVFAGGRTPVASAASPFGKPQKAPSPVDFVDSFDGTELGLSWQWDIQRAPTFKFVDGQLHLWPALRPGPGAAGTFLGVRVQKGDYTLTATVDRSGPAHEAIAIYGEANSRLTFRIEHEELIVSKTEKGESAQLAKAACPPTAKVHLRMTAREGHKFSFSASTDGKEWNAIGEEIDGAFIPPWDRAPRAGIFVSGKPSYVGKFDSVELRYERP